MGAVPFDGVGALEGPLARVDAQVVVEVVELAEVLLAVLEVALENFEVSLCRWVLVAVHSEVFGEIVADGVRTQLEDFQELVLTEGSTLLDAHLADPRWDFRADLHTADLAPIYRLMVIPVVLGILETFFKLIFILRKF